MEVPSAFIDSNESRLYNYITQHFLATLMGPCKYRKIRTEIQIGPEAFMYKGLREKISTDSSQGKRVEDPGFTSVMTWLRPAEEGSSASFKVGQECQLINARLVDGKTSPPDYLTESELIGLVRLLFKLNSYDHRWKNTE